MQISLGRPELVQTAVVAVVTIAALVFLGYIGAYWTWQWVAPRPEPHIQSQADAGGQLSTAMEFFGVTQKDAIATSSAPTGIAIRLLGIIAAIQGQSGYAVVVLNGKDIVATREGQDLAPGVRLAEVAADHIVLDRNGARETLAWPEKASAIDAASQKPNR